MKPRELVLMVEGEGDVQAVPTLARRVLSEIGGHEYLFVRSEKSMRVGGLAKLVKVKPEGQVWRRLLKAAGKTRPGLAAVMLVIDSDLDQAPPGWEAYKRQPASTFCVARAADALVEDAREERAGEAFSLAVCFVRQEFEAWLLAGIEGLRDVPLSGNRGRVPADAACPVPDVEAVRDAKGRLREWVPRYSTTLDGADFAGRVDLSLMRERSRSFRHFEACLRALVGAAQEGRVIMTPHAAA